MIFFFIWGIPCCQALAGMTWQTQAPWRLSKLQAFVVAAADDAHHRAVPVGIFPQALEDRLLLARQRAGERHCAASLRWSESA
jgi:hypothetical protein